MNVLAADIKRRGDQPQHARKDESGANGRAGRQTHDEDERGNREAAAANAGEADRERNQKADQRRSFVSSFEFGVDAALEFRAAPAARTRVGAGGGNRGARLAADAAIAAIIERQILDVMRRAV